MGSINEKVFEENNTTLHIIPTKKYKTINIVLKLKSPLVRETITKRALLPYVLQQGTKNFPSRNALQTKLDDLYGAVLTINGGKKGESHIISARLEIANEKFISEESSIMEDAIGLLKEIIFNPLQKDSGFDPAILEREKETLAQKIGSIVDDKMSYANMRLIDEMCEGEPYQLHVHGYKDDLSDISAETLYEYHQTLLKEDQFDIYVSGDFEDDSIIKDTIAENIRRTEYAPVEQQNEGTNKSPDPKVVTEKQDIQQAKLHIGYRTHTTYSDADYAALQVFNGLLGGFPSSKLFINVREKNSLAYYASSRVESHKGLLLVFSGIAPKDYEKAKEIIGLQVEAMKQGDFTESEMDETKGLIVNQLLETMDHPQGLIELLYQQALADTKMQPEELIENIKQVKKEDVVTVAKKIEEDTVYLLTNTGGNTDG
ncbi:EF-P 5-aminopentanol modification-associated protein YfmF [Virgibacillus byunsanensis]|uniref:EF-P 5-aminopentanol modification-associated protein YfmF n=1 Tax=Virgibacillus byunsanensis TaxID=570945 RepID=A0ABW3LHP9_9BACI